jgi:predicted DNA-binding ribbon-helix-helix protein
VKPQRPLRSANVKRSIHLDGRKTSVTLEDGFWNALKEIAAAQKTSASQLILRTDRARKGNNLSSAIRLFVLDYYRRAASR